VVKAFAIVRAGVMAGALVVAAASVSAQGGQPAPAPGLPSSQTPNVLDRVAFEQRLGEALPLDLPFKDEHGRAVRLREYWGQKPVVLAFVYYQCPMLCDQVLNGLASALDVLDESVGREFDVVTISFDARETPVMAAAKKKSYLERYTRRSADAGWHFLTADEATIEAVTRAAGFHYVWDERTQQFAHASGVIVTTPDGRLSRYLFGIDFAPRDLKFALIESSNGQVGRLADRLLLYCYHYDPSSGSYGLVVMRIIRAGGVVTLLALVGFVAVSLTRDRRAAGR
jgi:protein SCO1/2